MVTRDSKARRKSLLRVRVGATTVEFAIIAPLFLLLLGAIIEFGQAFRIEHMLCGASRLGARCGIVDGATTVRVKDKVKARVVQTLGIKEANITVSVAVNGNVATDVISAETGDDITVTVSVPFSKAAVGFFAKMMSNSILKSTTTLLKE